MIKKVFQAERTVVPRAEVEGGSWIGKSLEGLDSQVDMGKQQEKLVHGYPFLWQLFNQWSGQAWLTSLICGVKKSQNALGFSNMGIRKERLFLFAGTDREAVSQCGRGGGLSVSGWMTQALGHLAFETPVGHTVDS